MKLELIRTYYPNGTNGELNHNGHCICHTIELPWQHNAPNHSCVPEGAYALMKRYSDHLGWHLQVMDVENRDLILLHPANDAMKELKGCIAPVSVLTGEGRGDSSRLAFEKIKWLVFPVLEKQEAVWLLITSKAIQ